MAKREIPQMKIVSAFLIFLLNPIATICKKPVMIKMPAKLLQLL